VAASAEATAQVESFHFTLDIRNQPASTTGLQLEAAEGDVAVPDRLSADVSGTFAGTPLTTQLIVVGEKTLLKDPLTGSWREVDVNTSPIPFLDPAAGVLAVMRGAEGLEQTGSEEVDGVPSHRLVGTVTVGDISPLLGNPPGEDAVEATFWIGEEDSILRRVSVAGPINPGEPDDVLRVVELSRLGDPVEIELPKGFE
jgi:hypothetical protein